MAKRYNLGQRSLNKLKSTIRKVGAGRLSERPIATRRLPRMSGASGNVIYAQVVGAVASGDPTFTFDNAVAIVGSVPTGGTGTAQNNYLQEYVDNSWVLLFQRKDNDEWVTEKFGGSSVLLRFETTAAKDWDASTVAGVLLDATDTPVGGAITLTDRPPAKHEAQDGSRGWCMFSGAEFWIVTMDSPARWVEGVLNADWDLTSDSAVITKDTWWGASPNHLEPVESTITIYDNIKVRSRKYFAGERFRGIWDETLKLYVTNNTPGDYITIKGTAGAVTRATSTFTLAEVVGVNGQVPTGTITVTNDPPINTPGGRIIYARFNYSIGTDLQTAWDTGDGGNFLHHLRGLLDGGTEDRMVVDWHTASGEGSTDDPHWHKVAACTPPA